MENANLIFAGTYQISPLEVEDMKLEIKEENDLGSTYLREHKSEYADSVTINEASGPGAMFKFPKVEQKNKINWEAGLNINHQYYPFENKYYLNTSIDLGDFKTEETKEYSLSKTLAESGVKERKRKFTISNVHIKKCNPTVVEHLRKRLEETNKKTVVILLSEIFPSKIKLFKNIDAFVQIACPRLSIDWGKFFDKPVITPYEAAIVIGDAKWHKEEASYPMDFYASASLGPWTPNHKPDADGLNKCCGKCL